MENTSVFLHSPLLILVIAKDQDQSREEAAFHDK